METENPRKRPISAFTLREPPNDQKKKLLGHETDRGHLSRHGANTPNSTQTLNMTNPLNPLNTQDLENMYQTPYTNTYQSQSLPTSRAASRPISGLRRMGDVFAKKTKKTKPLEKRPAWNDRFYIRDGDSDDDDTFSRSSWLTASARSSKRSQAKREKKKSLSKTSGTIKGKRKSNNLENNYLTGFNTSEDSLDELDRQASDWIQGYDSRFHQGKRAPLNQLSNHRYDSDTSDSIQASYEKAKNRIKLLWKETNIKISEREDFENNYFLKHPTHDIMDIVFTYEQDLIHFRENTVNILKMIDFREEHVNALKRYVNSYSDGNIPESGISELRENLNSILTRIRNVTLEIVENIIEWRKNMTYSKPFIFDGENYVIKLQNDLEFFVDSPIASYASSLNQPFEEFNNRLGLSGINPPRLNSYQRKYIRTTLPSLGMIDEDDDEWIIFRDRIYRAFYFLAEEVQRFDEFSDVSKSQSSINLRKSDQFNEIDARGSFFLSESSISPTNTPQRLASPNSGKYQIKNMQLAQTQQIGIGQITFKSHFEANERSGYSTILDPTARNGSMQHQSISDFIQSIGKHHYIEQEEELLKKHKAATKLQSIFKGWITRKNLQNELRYQGKYVKKPLDQETVKLMHEALKSNTIREDDFEKIDRISRLQAGMRAIMAKTEHNSIFENKTSAAIKIQTTYRKWMAIKLAASLKHQKNIKYVIFTQNVIRMILRRQRYLFTSKYEIKYIKFVQRVLKMQKACLQLLKESDSKSKAILIIIRAIKYHLARKHFKQALIRHRASTVISKIVRGYLVRKRFRELKRMRSITLIQSCLRRNYILDDYKDKLRVREKLFRNTILIQSFIRTILVTRANILQFYQTKRKNVKPGDVFIHPQNAAEIIQRSYRCYLARKRLSLLREMFEEEIDEILRKEAETKMWENLSGGVPLHVKIIHLNIESSFSVNKLQ